MKDFDPIFQLVPDYDSFCEIDLEVSDFIQHFPDEFSYQDANCFDQLNLSLASFWPAMKTDMFEPNPKAKRLMPDISVWRNSCLLLSPNAYRYLYEALKSYGELLPIWVGEQKWIILNCLTTASLLKGNVSSNEWAFNSSEVANKYIFKCLEPELAGLFCTKKLKVMVESYGLRGIRFENTVIDFISSTEKNCVVRQPQI